MLLLYMLIGTHCVRQSHCRFLELTIAPAVAKRVFQVSAFSQILVGMSHFGVLFGVTSLILSTRVRTPLPWLRFGALMLLLVWVIPFYNPLPNDMASAWRLALLFTPISFGWAAGDLSLVTFIHTFTAKEKSPDDISVLGAVMSFLYTSYIILYTILSVVLGRFIDTVFAEDGNIKRALLNVGGIQFSVISAVVLLATFIPRGAWHLNPDELFNDSGKEAPRQGFTLWAQYKPILFRSSADTDRKDPKLVDLSRLRYE